MRSPSLRRRMMVTSMYTLMPWWMPWSCRVRIISRPVRSPTWAWPRSDLHTSPTETPAADASMAARSPAPPAPMTSTSCSWVSYSGIAGSHHSAACGLANQERVLAEPQAAERLKESRIVPNAHGAQADVEIGEADAEERQPGPLHVVLVEPGAQAPGSVAGP